MPRPFFFNRPLSFRQSDQNEPTKKPIHKKCTWSMNNRIKSDLTNVDKVTTTTTSTNVKVRT